MLGFFFFLLQDEATVAGESVERCSVDMASFLICWFWMQTKLFILFKCVKTYSLVWRLMLQRNVKYVLVSITFWKHKKSASLKLFPLNVSVFLGRSGEAIHIVYSSCNLLIKLNSWEIVLEENKQSDLLCSCSTLTELYCCADTFSSRLSQHVDTFN